MKNQATYKTVLTAGRLVSNQVIEQVKSASFMLGLEFEVEKGWGIFTVPIRVKVMGNETNIRKFDEFLNELAEVYK